MSWIYLSYILNPRTPAYANGRTMEIEKLKEIEKGDSCNTSFWKLPNHTGTHLDFPRHFDLEGKSIEDYNADFWIFGNVYLTDISRDDVPKIINEENIRLDEIPEETELLLIKTGFCQVRGREAYWEKSPIFSAKLAPILRGRYPYLRAIGIDTISISSMQDRELGRAAHRAFLYDSKPILIIEDMDLCEINSETCPKKVIAAPIRVSDTDGSPCTILGEVE